MAKKPIRIADVFGFGAAPRRDLTQGLRREVNRPTVATGALRPAYRPISQKIAEFVTPNTKAGVDVSRKIQGILDFATGLGSEENLVQSRGAFQRGEYGDAAKLGILAALGAIPGGRIGSKIDDVIRYAEQNGVKLSISNRPNSVSLNLIEVPKPKRSSGIGTDIMTRLSEAADAEGKVITLTPDISFGASSTNRLSDFYKRFGFVQNKGKNKDLQ